MKENNIVKLKNPIGDGSNLVLNIHEAEGKIDDYEGDLVEESDEEQKKEDAKAFM